MKLVYTIDTNSFEPISFGSNYLYNQYDRVNSFIVSYFGDEYKNLLAKPILTSGAVQWYSNIESPLSRLSDLAPQTQNLLKAEYWEVKGKLDAKISGLVVSADKEKQSWGKLLQEVFSDENNIVLSDGKDWCLLWGWKFRNRAENYYAPHFLTKTSPVAVDPEDTVPLVETTNKGNFNYTNEPSVIVPEEEVRRESFKPITLNTTDNGNILYRIKRFFRNYIYHYWGLLLVIAILLMYSCLLKNCKSDNKGNEALLKSKLENLEKKVKDRCKD
jgi:hypothetical protein